MLVRIPIRHAHSLSKHGYAASKSKLARHRALMKAVREQISAVGSIRRAYDTIIRKLGAIRVLDRRRAPAAAARFSADMRWLQSQRNGSRR